MSTKIPTETGIATAASEMVGTDLPQSPEELKALFEAVAREGYLAGLERAQGYVSREWPQGQYDRFNEHSLSHNLQRAIKRVKARR
jgi:hypothetical protein